METLRDNVECPSLSPDGTRIAFKQAIGADPMRGWRLSVLDLASMRVTETAEQTSVDDQAAWLDGGTLGYPLRQDDGRPDVCSVPADGTGMPRLLIPGAESPSPSLPEPSPPAVVALQHGLLLRPRHRGRRHERADRRGRPAVPVRLTGSGGGADRPCTVAA